MPVGVSTDQIKRVFAGVLVAQYYIYSLYLTYRGRIIRNQSANASENLIYPNIKFVTIIL